MPQIHHTFINTPPFTPPFFSCLSPQHQLPFVAMATVFDLLYPSPSIRAPFLSPQFLPTLLFLCCHSLTHTNTPDTLFSVFCPSPLMSLTFPLITSPFLKRQPHPPPLLVLQFSPSSPLFSSKLFFYPLHATPPHPHNTKHTTTRSPHSSPLLTALGATSPFELFM